MFGTALLIVTADILTRRSGVVDGPSHFSMRECERDEVPFLLGTVRRSSPM
jgi:hypothetical protein